MDSNPIIDRTIRENNARDVRTRIRFCLVTLTLLLFIAVAWNICKIDFGRLTAGTPMLFNFFYQMFPPDLSDLLNVAKGAGETLAMASIGTIFATILAFPLAFFAARNTTPSPSIYYIARAILNISRGTETLVFALVFVAAVGFGPFTGVLAITFHMIGAIGKVFAETIEIADKGPLDALALTGAGKLKVIRYGLMPDIMPALIAGALYMWEFSVRTSTVLGIVGAGGIGQILKDTVDLLNFNKMFTVLMVVLLMVAVIDIISDKLRHMILEPNGGSIAPQFAQA